MPPSARRGRSDRPRADGRRWRRGSCKGCWRRPCASAGIFQPRITSSKLPSPPLVDAIGVMHIARPVDADPDEIVVLLEEFRPFVVDQRAVGLDGVEHALVRLAVFVRRVRPNGGRSRCRAASARRPATPPPPAVRTTIPSAAGYRSPGVVRHQRALARRIEVFLRQEEAVLAAEVAGRAGGLRQKMIGGFRGHAGRSRVKREDQLPVPFHADTTHLIRRSGPGVFLER